MDKERIIAFFDDQAPHWDADVIKDDSIINRILDELHFRRGGEVLDVACGTGVMIPYYLERGAAHVTAIDFSPAMLERARLNLAEHPMCDLVSFICDDVELYPFDRGFDNIIIYNAFPHFPEPKRLIRRMSGLLKSGGTLTVAHGMSRDAINSLHKGAAGGISLGLPTAEALAEIFDDFLDVTVCISDERMYQVTGQRI